MLQSTLADPYLNLFRGLIPPLGGTLDLSPILAFVVLDVRFYAPPNETREAGIPLQQIMSHVLWPRSTFPAQPCCSLAELHGCCVSHNIG